MPKPTIAEVESKLDDLDTSTGYDLIFDLLLIYGTAKSGVSKARSGSSNKIDEPGQLLLKNKVFWRYDESLSDDDLLSAIDSARVDDKIAEQKPRFLIVANSSRLLAIDTKQHDNLDTLLSELDRHGSFFLPWTGTEKTELENLNYADVKAASKMAKLYDAIAAKNTVSTDEQVHELNLFFSRLLFCFFAEDTGVFADSIFTNAIASNTQENGKDLGPFLDELFDILDTPVDERKDVPAHFESFGYVNGRLFADAADCPTFTKKAREIILECATLDWSVINPDIFGSMIQAVAHPGQRAKLGMHYTSVENIMKVIKPLFLDELNEQLEKATTKSKLNKLHDRIANIRVFDPACGSGNFLIVSYKELRKIEHEILQRLDELDTGNTKMFAMSKIKLENFYGIEIDNFAHEIAILSLWLAKHQMNVEFQQLFGAEIPLIPLQEAGNIVCGNAIRTDWEQVCPPDDSCETYIAGNPPFVGARKKNKEQKADFEHYFGDQKGWGELDYVSLWLLKSADFMQQDRALLAALVATNSVCQGQAVPDLWPLLAKRGIETQFAIKSFLWSNRAAKSAGVTCVVLGLGKQNKRLKRLINDREVLSTHMITPYLTASTSNTIVRGRSKPQANYPVMEFGNMPRDGGHLLFNSVEARALASRDHTAARFLKPYVGAAEHLNGTVRFCLWIDDRMTKEALKSNSIAGRLQKVTKFREDSKAKSTRDFATQPHRFVQRGNWKDSMSLVLPRVSSGTRKYIPIGFLEAGAVASDRMFSVYDANPKLFGLLQSKAHMTWVDAVGGRMRTDYSYITDICYNAFPFPDNQEAHKDSISQAALGVLEAREKFPDMTLAQLYDPNGMPNQLCEAHNILDAAVDEAYKPGGFSSDDERLEHLFKMYEELTS